MAMRNPPRGPDVDRTADAAGYFTLGLYRVFPLQSNMRWPLGNKKNMTHAKAPTSCQDQEWIKLAADAERQYEEYLNALEFKACEPPGNHRDMERNGNVPSAIEFSNG